MTRELCDIQAEAGQPESVRSTLARTVNEVRESQTPPDWLPENSRDDWVNTPASIRNKARSHAQSLDEKVKDFDGSIDEQLRHELKRQGHRPGAVLNNLVEWTKNLSGPDGPTHYVELGRRLQSGQALAPQLVHDAHRRQEDANAIVERWSAGKEHFQKIRGRMASLVEQDANAGGRRFLSKDGNVNLDAAYEAAVQEAGLSKPASRASSSASRAGKAAPRPERESVRDSIKKALGTLR